MIGSLFSGIGGLELGLEWAGLGPVAWQVEIDDGCRALLAQHWPKANRSVSDVRTAGSLCLRRVDLICGGFPCQDLSPAGLGAGLEGARSGLWLEQARIIGELEPRWVLVENGAGAASRWLCSVRSDLQALGYVTAAVSISAADVGAPQERARIFVVGHAMREKLAHGDPVRRERISAFDGQEGLVDEPSGRDALGCHALGVADSHSLELRIDEQRQAARRARAVRHEGHAIAGDVGPPNGWGAQPVLGRKPDGLPPAVDRWPGARGALQRPWEAPREIVHVRGSNRRARLRALGNAVVPQCAAVIGRMIQAVEAGQPWAFVFA